MSPGCLPTATGELPVRATGEQGSGGGAAGDAFGGDDVVVLDEAPDHTAAAALAPTAGAGGALKAAETTELLSGQEWIDALRTAQGVAPPYRPAR